MELTARRLNRATLARQLLLEREPLPVEDAVRRVVAIQAQSPPSPYLALWSRVAGFEPSALDRAFLDRRVVKASLMRITLHAVHRDDWADFHAAMQPTLRASRLNDRRFRDAGLSPAQADALLPGLAAWAREPHGNAESQAWASEQLRRDGEWAWWALRTYAPLWHSPGRGGGATGGPWLFGQRPAYVAADAPPGHPGDPEVALRRLVRRYLEGFGPASAADVAQFAMVQRPRVKAALAALGDELVEHRGPTGEVLHDVPGAPLPDDDAPAPPRLLPMWDSTLLAYADRSRVLPEEHRARVIRRNGDVLPTLLVDGRVVGVWRTTDHGLEATAFEELDEGAWTGLASEAKDLLCLLADRDPLPYGRYGHWWRELPAGDTRVLGR